MEPPQCAMLAALCLSCCEGQGQLYLTPHRKTAGAVKEKPRERARRARCAALVGLEAVRGGDSRNRRATSIATRLQLFGDSPEEIEAITDLFALFDVRCTTQGLDHVGAKARDLVAQVLNLLAVKNTFALRQLTLSMAKGSLFRICGPDVSNLGFELSEFGPNLGQLAAELHANFAQRLTNAVEQRHWHVVACRGWHWRWRGEWHELRVLVDQRAWRCRFSHRRPSL